MMLPAARSVTCPSGCRVYIIHIANIWYITTVIIMQGYRKQGVEVTIVPLSITSKLLIREFLPTTPKSFDSERLEVLVLNRILSQGDNGLEAEISGGARSK